MLSFIPVQSKLTPFPPSNRSPIYKNPGLLRTPFQIPSPVPNSPRRLRIQAMDAAQPYDHETKISNQLNQSKNLKIAIVGFGNFGQFLAKTFVSQGHSVIAYSRTDYSHIAQTLKVSFFRDPNDLCEQHPDVILMCTSIISTERVLRSLPIQRLKRNTLFVDVLSVKEFPRDVFLEVLPPHFDILCTHPMFGPESGKETWKDLVFVYEKVRVNEGGSRELRVESFLDVFRKEGCRMEEMTCTEHDKYAAGSQFITHTVGRVLEKLDLEMTPVNTKGYETLLDLVKNTAGDSFDLFYGLFMYNKNAMEQLERLDLGFESLKKELFGHLHDVLRKQLFGKVEEEGERRVLSKLPNNGNTLASPSKDVKIDAAQPYDYESKVSNQFTQSKNHKIAIVGFGNFGQFLAKTFVRQGHSVLAHSRTDYSHVAQTLKVSFFRDPHDLCEQQPDVILLCTSIISTEHVLRSLPIQRLKRNTLFVDVLSVKEFPRDIFVQVLPPHFDVLCTHPMFGPESGKGSWKDLAFVYEKVRISEGGSRELRVESFLDVFRKEGCRMVEMTCADHDKYAAGSQFITHTVGRVLEKLGLETTPVNTKGYETLLDLVENTASDSFDLYYGLFMYNKNAMEQLERLDLAFESLKQELFGHLHDVLRKQLFGKVEEDEQRRVWSKLPKSGNTLTPPSIDAIKIENN